MCDGPLNVPFNSLQEIRHCHQNQSRDAPQPFTRVILPLRPLEIQLGQLVQAVRQLQDQEQFQHEAHRRRVVAPKQRHIEQVLLPVDDIQPPKDGHEVEGGELAAGREHGEFGLGEVQLLGDLVEDVLLDDRVQHDADEAVEEDGGPVADARHVEGHLARLRHVVLQRDEDRRDRGRRLK